MATIQLKTGGYTAIVDDEDVDRLAHFRWRPQKKSCGKVYAISRIVVNGKQSTIRMHRLIMNAPSGVEVDHRNHNGLDNRKENLRLATDLQNARNKRKSHSYFTSRFKGVHRTERGYWKSGIRVNGTQINIGTFDDELLAAAAYNFKAKELFGEFACLNQVDDRLESVAMAIAWNPKKKRNPLSRYLGVGIQKTAHRKWFARIISNGKSIFLGGFLTELEAAEAYNKAAIELYGANAKLNLL